MVKNEKSTQPQIHHNRCMFFNYTLTQLMKETTRHNTIFTVNGRSLKPTTAYITITD